MQKLRSVGKVLVGIPLILVFLPLDVFISPTSRMLHNLWIDLKGFFATRRRRA